VTEAAFTGASMTEEAFSALNARVRTAEGFRAEAYQDTTGVLTIGYGCSVRSWSESFAARVLTIQLAEAEDAVTERLPWTVGLSDQRQATLTEMAFNLGITGLLGFHDFLGHLQRAEWPQAGMQLLASVADHEEPARVQRWIAEITNG
jgi:lysozyme